MKTLLNLLALVAVTFCTLGNAKTIVSLEDLVLQPASGNNIIFNDGSLTPSRPIKVDSANNLITGLILLSDANDISGTLGVANGGTGSTTQNYVDLTTGQSIAGLKTFNDSIIVSSTTSGAIPCPVMTGAERDLIGSPSKGDCLFNSTTNVLNTYSGSAWEGVGSGGGGIAEWVTATGYTTDDVIFTDDKIYVALLDHTSGVFATDLANLDWSELSPVSESTQGLASVTTIVNVSAAAAPTLGQVLTATSDSAATWQTPDTVTDISGTSGSTDSLTTTGDDVVVSGASPPTLGQVLTATSSTVANWQTPDTITDISGTAGSAGGLVSATTIVDVSAAAAPTSGQVLTATSDSLATWQTPSTVTDISGTSGSTLGLSSVTTIVDVSSAAAPTVGQVLTATSDSAATWQTPAAGGDVSGGTSSIDNEIVRFDGTTGKLIQAYTSDGPTISDTGVPSFAVSAFTASQRVGELSSVGSTYTSAFGYNANASGSQATVIGANSVGAGTASVAIGTGANSSGYTSTAIGANSFTNSQSYAIALGYSSRAETASSFNIGSYSSPITNMFLGEGEHTNLGAHADVSIRPTRPINVTDTQGGDLLLLGAGSTGTEYGSSVKIQTQTAVSATGTTANVTWSDMFEVTGLGEVITNAELSATADASLWANSLSMYMDETDDNLKIKMKDSGSTVRVIDIPYYTEREILKNSSFEDTTAANGWTCTGGAATTEPTEIVKTEGAQSLKYTVTASTFSCYQTYDCSKSPTIPQGFLAYVQSTDDIEVCGYDGTNDINCVTPTSDDVFQLALAENTGGGTCGIKIKSDTAITDVIYIDGVKFTDQPYRFVDINEVGSWDLTEATSTWSRTASNIIYRSAADPTFNILGDASCLSFTNDSTNGFKLIATKDCLVNAAVSVSTTSGTGVNVLKNNTLIRTGGGHGFTGPKDADASIFLAAGDYLTWQANALDGARVTSFTIGVQSQSEAVVVPATLQASQVTGSGNDATTTTGNVTDLNFTEVTDINGDFDGTTFTVPRDGNYLISGLVNFSAGAAYDVRAYVGGTVVKRLNRVNATGPIQHFSGAVVLEKGDLLTFRTTTGGTLANTVDHHINIQEIPSDAKLLAAIPTEKTAYIKHQVSAGVASGSFTAATFVTRPLNVVTGDTEIVSVASNAFTLQAGTYKIYATAQGYNCDEHKIRLRQTSGTAATIITGSSEYAISGSSNSSKLSGSFTITAATTYEIQHEATTNPGGNGMGVSKGTSGEDEVFAQVTITKLITKD